MLVIRVELWPNSDASHAVVIAEGRIINDGTGTQEHGNYSIVFRERSPQSNYWKVAKRMKLAYWPRRTRGPLALLRAALAYL